MRVNGAVLLLLLIVCIALALALGQVGSQAVNVWAEQAQQPPSAADTILQSRQTPAVTPDDGSRVAWLGAGLLAVTLVVLGAVLFTMRGGAELLRQWRLARKRPSRRRQQTPYPPTVTWTEIPQARPVRYLPEVDDEQMVDVLD